MEIQSPGTVGRVPIILSRSQSDVGAKVVPQWPHAPRTCASAALGRSTATRARKGLLEFFLRQPQTFLQTSDLDLGGTPNRLPQPPSHPSPQLVHCSGPQCHLLQKKDHWCDPDEIPSSIEGPPGKAAKDRGKNRLRMCCTSPHHNESATKTSVKAQPVYSIRRTTQLSLPACPWRTISTPKGLKTARDARECFRKTVVLETELNEQNGGFATSARNANPMHHHWRQCEHLDTRFACCASTLYSAHVLNHRLGEGVCSNASMHPSPNNEHRALP